MPRWVEIALMAFGALHLACYSVAGVVAAAIAFALRDSNPQNTPTGYGGLNRR